MAKLVSTLVMLVVLTACSANPLTSGLLGGKPVGVNGQIGKENNQTIGQSIDYGSNSLVVEAAAVEST